MSIPPPCRAAARRGQRQAAGAGSRHRGSPHPPAIGRIPRKDGRHPRQPAEKTLIGGAVTGPVGRGARGGRGGTTERSLFQPAFIGLSRVVITGAARRRSNPDVEEFISKIASLALAMTTARFAARRSKTRSSRAQIRQKRGGRRLALDPGRSATY